MILTCHPRLTNEFNMTSMAYIAMEFEIIVCMEGQAEVLGWVEVPVISQSESGQWYDRMLEPCSRASERQEESLFFKLI